MSVATLFGRRAAGALTGAVAADALGRASSQMLILVLARRLGAEQFGFYSVGLTLSAVVTLVADGGIGQSVYTESLNSGEPVAMNNRVAGLRLRVAGLVTLGVGAGVAVSAGEYRLPVLVGLASVPLQIRLGSEAFALRAANRIPTAVALLSVASMAAVACSVVGVAAGVGTATTSLALSMVGWSGILLILCMQRRRIRYGQGDRAKRDLGDRREKSRQILRRAIPFLISTAAVTIYTRGDRLVLAAFASPTTVGNYSAAYTLILITSLIGNAITVVSLPTLARWARLPAFPRARYLGCALGVVSLGALCAAVLTLGARPLVSVIYGNRFEEASGIVGPLAWISVFYLVNPLLGNLLIVAGRAKAFAKATSVGLAVSVVGYPLAAWHAGAIGLARASVAVEAVVALAMVTMIVKFRLLAQCNTPWMEAANCRSA